MASAETDAGGLTPVAEGAGEWWHERLSSLSTLLLLVWLLVSLLRLPALDYGVVAEWLSSTLNVALMLLLIVSIAWHVKLGMKVIIDDYVHGEGGRAFSLILLYFAVAVGAAIAIVALLKIAGGGPAA